MDKFDPRIKETPDMPGELYDEKELQALQQKVNSRFEQMGASHIQTYKLKCARCGEEHNPACYIEVKGRPEHDEPYCEECWSDMCLEAYWEAYGDQEED